MQKKEQEDLGGVSPTEVDGASVLSASSAASHAAPTPGPWAIYFGGSRPTIYGGEGQIAVCMVFGKQNARVPDPKTIPNAHLIAAAPEMYEALKAATDSLDVYCDDAPIFKRVLAAIAKAEGR